MRKRGWASRSLLATALALMAGGANASEEKVVNVYNWSDYIEEGLLKDFEKETGIKVVYDTYDSNEILDAKLLAGGAGYDVVFPSATFLMSQIKAGVYRELDSAKLPNRVHLWPEIMERQAAYDPWNRYAVNYMWGTTGIGYSEDMIKQRMPDAPVGSWRIIFDPAVISKFADCGVHVLDAPVEMIPAALNYLGEDPRSQDPKALKKAEALLASIRPHIRKFHSSEYINALANGDICLAVGYSGDIFMARSRAEEAKNGIRIAYVIPQEGAQMWFDVMAIPKSAPHPDNAYRFIDYLLRPDVIAKASNYVFYANGNQDSQKMLDAAVIDNPEIYPSAAGMARLYSVETYGRKFQRLVTRSWTRIKSGH